MKIVNFRCLLILSVAQIAGIILCFHVSVIFSALVLGLLIISAVEVAKSSQRKAYCGKSQTDTEKYLLLAVLTLVLSLAVTTVTVFSTTSGETEYEGFGSARISDAEYFTKSNCYYLDNVLVEAEKVQGSASFYSEERLSIGSVISFKGSLSLKDVSTKSYRKDVRYSATLEEYTISASSFSVKGVIKESVLAFLEAADFNGEESGVLYSMLFGDTGLVQGDTLQAMRYAGIGHIFAVSGLHVGILYGVLSVLLKRTRIIVRTVASIAVMLFYVYLCSFSPSAMRAFIMLSVLLVSKCCGKRYDFLSALALSSILILLIKPIYIFDAGFILSFYSVLSIKLLSGFFRPHISSKPCSFGKNQKLKYGAYNLMKKFLADFSTVLAAQVGLFLLVSYYFGYISPFSVLFNMLLVPVLSATVSLSFILLPILVPLSLDFLYTLPLFIIALVCDLMSGNLFSSQLIITYRAPLITVLAFTFAMVFASGVVLLKKRSKILISGRFLAVAAITAML